MSSIVPGAQIDHFQLIRPIGEGAFGQVWLARDLGLGRKVALKFVHAHRLVDRQAGERFLLEARTTARFNHPNIVQIFHVGESTSTPYVALEYVEGQSLRARLEQGALGPTEAARIVLAVARALREAHSAGVLHRDLKPANVLIGRDGRPRVVDFGLAKISGATTTAEPPSTDETEPTGIELTLAGALVGTPGYMSPEQHEALTLGPPSDVWALGIILFELLSGQRPYAAPSISELGALVAQQPVPPLVGVPDVLGELVEHCLAKEPGRRPSASNVCVELEQFLQPAGSRRSEDSPFRGLQAFGEQNAELFFGREREIAALVETLRERPVVPVVGPSGAGKSSLVFGGLVPRLRESEPWTVISLRPGAHPFAALESRLIPDEQTLSIDVVEGSRPLESELLEAPRRLGLRLRQLAANTGTRVLLIVDQLEEIFTLAKDPRVCRNFTEAVCTAADEASDPVRVVFTLRDDFLGRVAVAPELREILGQLVLVRAPEADALAETLQRPVQLRGYSFEDGVVQDMVAEVAGMEASLPLLQFAGTLLWERRDSEQRLLTRAACTSIGGVAGALTHHAESVIRRLTAEQLAQARLLLLRLVTVNRTRRVVGREQLLAGLAAEDVLAQLVDARLLSLRQDGPSTLVELAHEALIERWDRLGQWLRDARDEVRVLTELDQATTLWEQRGHRTEEVWTGEALNEALRAVDRMAEPPSSVVAFLDAGRRVERKRGRSRSLLVATVLAVLIGIAAGSMWTALEFREREQRALQLRAEQEIALLRAEARIRDRAGRRSDAISLLRAAVVLEDELGRGDSGSDAVSLLRRLSGAGFLRKTVDIGEPITDVAVQGSLLSVGDKSGRLRWLDLQSGEAKWEGKACVGRWYSADFSDDGRLARGCSNGRVEVRAPDGSLETDLTTNDAHVESVRWYAGALVALSSDGIGRIWDRGYYLDQEPREIDLGHRIDLVSYSGDGHRVAVANLLSQQKHRGRSVLDLSRWQVVRAMSGSLHVTRGLSLDRAGERLFVRLQERGGVGHVEGWDVASGERFLHQLEKFWSGDVAISPSGKLLARSGSEAELLDPETGTVLHSHPRPGRPTDTSFAPNSRLVALGDWDGELQILDTGSGAQLHREKAHSDRVYRPLWLDNERLVTWSDDRTLSLWSARGQVEQSWEVPGGATATPVTHGSGWIAGGSNGALQPMDGSPILSPSSSAVEQLVSRDDLLAVAQADGTLSLYEDLELRWSRTLPGGRVRRLALTEGHVVAGSTDGVLRRIALDSPDELSSVEISTFPVTELKERRGWIAALAGAPGHLVLITPEGRTIGPIQISLQSYGLSFSPDGNLLAVGAGENASAVAEEGWDLKLFDARSGEEVFTSSIADRDIGRLQSIAWSPSGERLLTGSLGSSLRLWNIAEGRVEATFQPDRGTIMQLEFIDERRALVGSLDDILELWDLEAGIPIQVLPDYDANLYGWARSGARLAYASREIGVMIARLADPEDQQTLLERTGAATNLRICRETAEAVPIVPFPPADSVWAPEASCEKL